MLQLRFRVDIRRVSRTQLLVHANLMTMKISAVRGQMARLHGQFLLEGVQRDAAVHTGIAVRRQNVVGAARVITNALRSPASGASPVRSGRKSG